MPTLCNPKLGHVGQRGFLAVLVGSPSIDVPTGPLIFQNPPMFDWKAGPHARTHTPSKIAPYREGTIMEPLQTIFQIFFGFGCICSRDHRCQVSAQEDTRRHGRRMGSELG